MLTQTIRKRIRVPKVWNQLLAIDEFDETVKSNPLAVFIGEEAHVSDPTPYLDDVREVWIKESGFEIRLQLCSGQNNYYVGIVVDGPGESYYESDPIHHLDTDNEIQMECPDDKDSENYCMTAIRFKILFI